MPSSIASLASGGGASAAAVASSSATNISAVRAAVGRSSTSRPRSLRPRPPVARQRRDDLVRGARSQARHLRSRGLRVRNTWSGRPFVGDLGVQPAALEQLVVRAARGDARRPRARRSRRPARSSTAGGRSRTSCGRPSPRAARSLISCSVEASTERGGVVEDQDARVGEQRARDRDPLALAARQRQPALADARVVAVGQLGDEAGRLGALGRALDLLARSRPAARRRCSRARWPRTGTGRRRRPRSARRSEARSTVAHVGAVDQHRARASTS